MEPESVYYKRTPELEDFLVDLAITITSLGNRLLDYLPKELYRLEQYKAISEKDLKYIIAQVVLQYDAAIGISALGDDPIYARKMKEKLDEMEAKGLVEKVEKDAEDVLLEEE